MHDALDDDFGVGESVVERVVGVETFLDRRTPIGKLLRLQCALVAPIAQGLADDLAAGGVPARLDGATNGRSLCNGT